MKLATFANLVTLAMGTLVGLAWGLGLITLELALMYAFGLTMFGGIADSVATNAERKTAQANAARLLLQVAAAGHLKLNDTDRVAIHAAIMDNFISESMEQRFWVLVSAARRTIGAT